MNLTKKGNLKVDKSCTLFNLPTSVCSHECPGCYAKKAELRFPAVKVSRDRNYNASLNQLQFISDMHDEIVRSKNDKFRIHESGDFYSQSYINVWYNIISHLPSVQFYAYTKEYYNYDFTALMALPNMNLINSITPLGVNFGDQAYCDTLVDEFEYVLCPCKKDVHVACMKDCTICLTVDKVCFLKH